MERPVFLIAVWVLLCVCAPSTGADGEFGVNIRFFGNAEEQAEMLAVAGVRWVRLDLAWSAAETQPGVYDFGIWDRFVEAFEPFGIRLLFILDYGNEMYDDGFPPTTEEGRAAFASYAGAAARHFRGRAMWEIWNEPNVPTWWAGAPDAAAYVELARAASSEIRREDPGAWIVGPSLGGGAFDFAYLEETFRLGLLEIVDAVSLHPYGASHPEAATAFYEEVRRLMAAYAGGRVLPLVVSEWGYAADELGPEGQADFLERMLEVNREAEIAMTIWFNWREPLSPWNSFGLIDVHGRPKPAYEWLVRRARTAASASDRLSLRADSLQSH